MLLFSRSLFHVIVKMVKYFYAENYQSLQKNILFRNAYLIFVSSLLLCLQWLVAGVAASAPGPAPVDLLAALRLDQHEAVVKTTGICETREGHKGADTAYKLVKKSVISVPTATVFPGY